MLAQNFKSAADLGITEPQKEALMKTLVLLETGKLVHVEPEDRFTNDFRETEKFTGHFNMARWRAADSCGTVACIAGTAEIIGGVQFPVYGGPSNLNRLFAPASDPVMAKITTEQAATALRSYLTTGDPRWDLAA